MNAITPAISSIGAIALNAIELPAAALVERAALTRALDITKRAVERRNTLPILSNALLAASGGALAVVTTDLDMQLTVTVPGAVDAAFQMTAPAHDLESFLKKASACDMVAMSTQPGPMSEHRVDPGTPQERMEPCTESGACTIEFERVKYRLNCLPVRDYPTMQPGEFSHEFELSGDEFWNMVDGTINGVSTEETCYYLNGIYAHCVQRGNRHEFTLVATDGHRLYRQAVESPAGAIEMPGAIIPRKTCDLAHKLMKGKACPDTVSISVNDCWIKLAFGDVEILSKLVAGTFPDYNRVIPTGNANVMTVDRDLFAEALRSVSLVSSERGRAVKFEICGGFCKLVVTNPETGSAEATIDCGWSAGIDCLEIGFNNRYVAAILADAGPGAIAFRFNDAGSPTLISSEREGWDAVLMPMRV